jgi:23S rRNA (uracil-5-)-methyltransferase RumA
MKRNDIIQIKLNKFKTLNRTTGYFEEMPIFVKGGMPGQTADVIIKRKRNNVCEANFLKLVSPAWYEKKVSCSSYGLCGGCTFLSMPYEMQTRYKTDYILNLFRENNIKFQNFLGFFSSPKTMGYRNKMEFSFGNTHKNAPLTLGMHKKDRFYDIISAEECELIDEDFKTILKNTVSHCNQHQYSYYHRGSHKGLLRHLIIRKGEFTNQLMINIIITSQEAFDEQSFLNMLLNLELDKNIVSVIKTINNSISDAIHAEAISILYGRDYMQEKCLDKTFNISPFSFFQTNSSGCEVLYGVVIKMLHSIQCDTIFDLYCGTGTITQMVCEYATKVIGIEIVADAIESAKKNAELNNIKNCSFICGDVLDVIYNIDENPDVIILDPPRAGMHPKVLGKIASFNSKHILYVSCNPTALIKDLKYLIEHRYVVNKLAIVDMFPHTPHVETVILMSRVKE